MRCLQLASSVYSPPPQGQVRPLAGFLRPLSSCQVYHQHQFCLLSFVISITSMLSLFICLLSFVFCLLSWSIPKCPTFWRVGHSFDGISVVVLSMQQLNDTFWRVRRKVQCECLQSEQCMKCKPRYTKSNTKYQIKCKARYTKLNTKYNHNQGSLKHWHQNRKLELNDWLQQTINGQKDHLAKGNFAKADRYWIL